MNDIRYYFYKFWLGIAKSDFKQFQNQLENRAKSMRNNAMKMQKYDKRLRSRKQ